MFATTILALATSLLVAVPAQPAADPSADLSVAFRARPTLILTGAVYDISVTNNGPDALASATVVLTVDLPVSWTSPATCAVDTAQGTVTCPLGPVPAGSTATVSPSVYFTGLTPQSGRFTTTVTTTASTPVDPNPANDSVSEQCSYLFYPMPPQAPYWVVGCS